MLGIRKNLKHNQVKKFARKKRQKPKSSFAVRMNEEKKISQEKSVSRRKSVNVQIYSNIAKVLQKAFQIIFLWKSNSRDVQAFF